MNRKLALTVALLILALVTLACGQLGNTPPTEAPQPADVPAPVKTASPPVAAPTATSASIQEGVIRQWAVSATASSEYSNPAWSAMQATGAPDTRECGDQETAWASAAPDTVEWIELNYRTFVHPTEVNIFQSYSPNQVVKVELIDNVSAYHEIYAGRSQEVGRCPYILSIPVKDADYAVGGIRITIDQTAFQNWNEIDAVELLGVPAE